MSDQLEKFVRSNREQFDRSQPRPELWDKIQTGLNQHAAATGSAAAGSQAATGAAKVATAWKIGAAVLAVATASVVTWWALSSGKPSDSHGKDQASASTATTTQVEPDKAAAFINPPLPTADIPYHTLTVDGTKGGNLELPNGTRISVPPMAFRNGQGAAAEGTVEIHYREFHDAADIIVSGIPMTYNNHGKIEDFETAGMMEILGFQNGQPVSVAPGKEIAFEMTSYTTEDNYNFYYLDPEKRAWQDLGKPGLIPAKRKKAQLGAVSDSSLAQAPRKPVGIADVTKDGDIGFQVNYNHFPELKPYKNVRWAAADPAFLKKNQWIFTAVWNDVQLEEVPGERMAYNMILSNSRKKFTLPALPVLDGQEYEAAMKDFRDKKAKYDKMLAQRKNEGQRIELQENVARTFKVSKFGIFNCDRFATMPNLTSVTGQIEFGDEVYMDNRNTMVFQILSNRAVRSLENIDRPVLIRYSNSDPQHLISILPDGTIAAFSPEDFKKLEAGKPGVQVLKMRHTGRKVSSAMDIRAFLEG